MEPFDQALAVTAGVTRDGAITHPSNDWPQWRPEYHLHRAERHLRLLHQGDWREDHLAYAATRLLMALTLRELG